VKEKGGKEEEREKKEREHRVVYQIN